MTSADPANLLDIDSKYADVVPSEPVLDYLRGLETGPAGASKELENGLCAERRSPTDRGDR
jgi:hypothetical protein